VRKGRTIVARSQWEIAIDANKATKDSCCDDLLVDPNCQDTREFERRDGRWAVGCKASQAMMAAGCMTDRHSLFFAVCGEPLIFCVDVVRAVYADRPTDVREGARGTRWVVVRQRSMLGAYRY
jgi:hypothetical protein